MKLTADAYWELDENFRFTFVSDVIRWRAAVPRPAYAGRTRWEMQPAGATHGEWAAHRALLDAGEPFRNFEFTATLDGGHTVRLSASGDPVFDRHGRFKGYRGITTDVSHAKQQEDALRESEERYRLTFERAAVGVSHTGLDGRFLRVNDMVCELTGYSREELVTVTFRDMTHPDDLQRSVHLVARLLAREVDTFSMEKRDIRRDGTVVWAHLTVSLLLDAEGAPRHFVSVIQDISERKAAEAALKGLNARLEQQVLDRTRALRESEERTRLAANAGGVALSEWNRSPERMIWSDLAFTTLGFAPGEIVPSFKVWAARVHPDDLPRVKQRFEQAMKDHDRVREEYRVVWRDGTIHVHECQGEFTYDDQGACVRLRGIWIDITERKENERHRIERELRLRRALVRDVHHRIKNHQQAVAGLLHNAIRRQPDLREAIAPAVAQMRALSIVHGLSGKALEPIDVAELVSAIVQMTESLAEGTNPIRYPRRVAVRLSCH